MAQYAYANGDLCYYEGMDEDDQPDEFLDSLAQYDQYWGFFPEAEDPVALAALAWEAEAMA